MLHQYQSASWVGESSVEQKSRLTEYKAELKLPAPSFKSVGPSFVMTPVAQEEVRPDNGKLINRLISFA